MCGLGSTLEMGALKGSLGLIVAQKCFLGLIRAHWDLGLKSANMDSKGLTGDQLKKCQSRLVYKKILGLTGVQRRSSGSKSEHQYKLKNDP